MTVFANGLEIACKAQTNQVIAAFPDVCFTPPQTPATPPGVPIPYPSFGTDSDTDKGTSTVKIGGKTVTQKNQSYYTKTMGTEAGCAPKKGVVSSQNTGKEYAEAWSGNVKMDGEPISRFTDISTNNHASPVGNAPPWPKVAAADLKPGQDADCLVGSYDDIAAACANAKPPGEAHHIVPDKAYRTGTRDQAIAAGAAGASTITRTFGRQKRNIGERVKNAPSIGEGVCICISKSAHKKIHKKERAALKKLGQKVPANLKGAAKKAHIETMKSNGTWNTANLGDIIAESKKTISDIKQDKNGNPTAACIAKAKAAVTRQTANIGPNQVGRTSGTLPNKAAASKMLNTTIS
ncbi:DUF4150 domain-containing protein [Mesorhizobium japonicum]|uniref:Mlr2353 protein n=1 Tax=Mesorhizobium japonicum (strain LMG 29417 / CECT 9101 / MAFF 303099) TaxID=266835 RepID=Q98IL1_RHILO|nr:DUF4150 domain-containing protein [Mesorhizobium japonicum]BAB49505.1 mlr2353 [Mesorhizobium japonicum MAFF 303099]